jgi:uncharacterized iron-regulated protein
MLHSMALKASVAAPLWLAWGACSCAAVFAASPTVLIFGEAHDQPDQQRQVAQAVEDLAGEARLSAVVLEMAETPHHTATLPRDASQAQVRESLQWKGWPWEAYAAIVMNAVRAGVPVWGGNLPRAEMRAAMSDAALDQRIDSGARAAIAEAVRGGHCGLLPESREPGMVRIQIARDASMARVVAKALHEAAPGSLVLLLAGAQHASRDRGVPLQLQRDAGVDPHAIRVVLFGDSDGGMRADELRSAIVTPRPDPCEALRQQMAAPPPASAASR